MSIDTWQNLKRRMRVAPIVRSPLSRSLALLLLSAAHAAALRGSLGRVHMSASPRKRKAATAASDTPGTKTAVAKTSAGEHKGSFGCALDGTVPPHTLILGTQPSDVSLGANRYYDTHTNVLWHIVGDALGWRRGWLDGKGRAPPASITSRLLHEASIESYDEALAQLTSRGYCLWDVLKESERAGSLDGAITNARPADVRGLVGAHPSIERICFSSGATTANFFKTHFGDWLKEEGAFRVHPNKPTQQVFGQLVPPGGTGIELVVMESVSPAYVPRVSVRESTKRRAAYAEAGCPQLSARASAYGWKRQQWFEACFARVLSPEERSKRFGERDGDLLDEEE